MSSSSATPDPGGLTRRFRQTSLAGFAQQALLATPRELAQQLGLTARNGVSPKTTRRRTMEACQVNISTVAP